MASPDNNEHPESQDMTIIFDEVEPPYDEEDNNVGVYHLVLPEAQSPPPPIINHPSPLTYNRLSRELANIIANPPEGCQVFASEDTFEWVALINGPQNSLYEGGLFKVSFQFPVNYPFSPPLVRFETKILHCNISPSGWICSLDDIWMPVQTVESILRALILLLMVPIPEEPMNDSAATLYIQQRETYEYNVRVWTERFAMPEDVLRSIEFIN